MPWHHFGVPGMKIWILAWLLLSGVNTSGAQAPASANQDQRLHESAAFLLVIDHSGSMNERMPNSRHSHGKKCRNKLLS
ncbi:MAG: hypothetical protein KatS3mg113_0570 [Planctomycetaceae bacterium]|nr:MAG: hypothetical protein KatS3mg113_0570 [Planctomycetaceae bacterium]